MSHDSLLPASNAATVNPEVPAGTASAVLSTSGIHGICQALLYVTCLFKEFHK
jgi:hypothetical protein